MRILISALMSLLAASPALAQTASPVPVAPPAQTRPASFADLADRLLPTVVNISSTSKGEDGANLTSPLPDPQAPPPGSPFEDFYENYMNRQQGGPLTESASLGSGFIIDAEKGLIITNNHVIRDASDIRITLHDDSTYKATIVGTDDKTDIALLKIDPKGHPLKQVSFGDSDSLRVGDWIMAIGNPFGLGGTVTAGIVSARKRDINAGPYDDFIQTDASINRGNSGGPMFNLKGEVIGINTAIFSPSGGSVGIGFAIPVNLSRPVIKQLVAYGKTRRGWLGAKIQSVTPEIAESLGLGEPRGALIAAVTPKGPSAVAGIKPYDIVLSFDGRSVRTMRDLPRLVAEAEVGKPIAVELYREGQTMSLNTTLGELETAESSGMIEADAPAVEEPAPVPPPAPKKLASAGTNFRSLGLIIAPISRALTDKYGLVDGMTGLVVTKVADYSDAAKKGLLPGDVIMEVNQEATNTVADLEGAIMAARSDNRSSVLMLIDRAGDERFVAVKLDEGGAQAPAKTKAKKPAAAPAPVDPSTD